MGAGPGGACPEGFLDSSAVQSRLSWELPFILTLEGPCLLMAAKADFVLKGLRAGHAGLGCTVQRPGASCEEPRPHSLCRSSDSASFDLRVMTSWHSAPTSWDVDCVAAVEDKLSLCVPGEVCGLFSQLLYWVCRNMLCFAKYELLKFRRNAGAASQASALYQKWTVRWTVRGRPVGPTHLCADGYHMDTRRICREGPPELRGLRVKPRQNRTSLLPEKLVQLSQCR